jgi:thiol-disulfide isomerase/thioredoxin
MSRSGRQIINTKQSAPIARRRNAFAIGSVVLLGILIIVAVALANRVPPAATVAPQALGQAMIGKPAPDFTLSTTAGPFQLSKAGGQPTLLEVFATWCPHCQREVKVIDPIYLTYKDKVHFVGVNGDARAIDFSSPESQADIVDWTQKFDVLYPVAFDPDLSVAHAYLQDGFPTLVLIGADGKVEAIRDGEIPPADIRKALDAAIAGKTPDPKMGAKV